MAIAVAAVGLAIGVYGAVESGNAQKRQGRQETTAANAEADQLDVNAGQEVAAASYNASNIQAKVQKILASQRNLAAAAGNDTTSGSVKDIADDTVKQASLDELMTMANAENSAAKDRYNATQDRKTGIASGTLAESRAAATGISGASTLLSGSANWLQRYGGVGAKPGTSTNLDFSGVNADDEAALATFA